MFRVIVVAVFYSLISISNEAKADALTNQCRALMRVFNHLTNKQEDYPFNGSNTSRPGQQDRAILSLENYVFCTAGPMTALQKVPGTRGVQADLTCRYADSSHPFSTTAASVIGQSQRVSSVVSLYDNKGNNTHNVAVVLDCTKKDEL